MKRGFLVCLLMSMGAKALAGGSTGGIGALTLETMALAETELSPSMIREIVGNGLLINTRSSRTMSLKTSMMESINDAPAGILIEVQSSDFDLVVADAANGQKIIYRNAIVRATGIDPESKIVTMTLVDDPSVTVVVKGAESK